MRITLGLLAALLLALPAEAQYSHRGNTASWDFSATTPCPGAGCMTLGTGGAGTAIVTISGTYAATFQFNGSNDECATLTALIGYPFASGQTGTPVSTLAANATGTWIVPTLGFAKLCLKATAYTSNTSGLVKLDADPASLLIALTAATTTSTAPGNTTLTAATATKVFTATAGICQVTCQNIDAAIAMKCGQTNTVSATVGLNVTAGNSYTTSWGYGGDVWCFPASGTPAASCQATVCP